MNSIYKRVLVKLSGEALSGGTGHGIDQEVLNNIVDQIINVSKSGVEVGVVVGAGNFWRGRQGTEMDRTAADHMGMLATVLNAIAIKDAIDRRGGSAVVQTALEINRVAENYSHEKAMKYLKKGKIVIFACGTGNPYFTTDTGAALKAAEIEADALLLAKNVDGIYDSDPRINKNAKKIDEITYKEYHLLLRLFHPNLFAKSLILLLLH